MSTNWEYIHFESHCCEYFQGKNQHDEYLTSGQYHISFSTNSIAGKPCILVIINNLCTVKQVLADFAECDYNAIAKLYVT